ncbi:acetyltransferase [Vibrio cholerae]|nr:acetyltransferase [Vibrio cholerae]
MVAVVVFEFSGMRFQPLRRALVANQQQTNQSFGNFCF